MTVLLNVEKLDHGYMLDRLRFVDTPNTSVRVPSQKSFSTFSCRCATEDAKVRPGYTKTYFKLITPTRKSKSRTTTHVSRSRLLPKNPTRERARTPNPNQQDELFCPVSGCSRAKDALVPHSFDEWHYLGAHVYRMHPGFVARNLVQTTITTHSVPTFRRDHTKPR